MGNCETWHNINVGKVYKASRRKNIGGLMHDSADEILADAEEVEINERGEIVPIGTKGRKGVKPPPHTFY